MSHAGIMLKTKEKGEKEPPTRGVESEPPPPKKKSEARPAAPPLDK